MKEPPSIYYILEYTSRAPAPSLLDYHSKVGIFTQKRTDLDNLGI